MPAGVVEIFHPRWIVRPVAVAERQAATGHVDDRGHRRTLIAPCSVARAVVADLPWGQIDRDLEVIEVTVRGCAVYHVMCRDSVADGDLRVGHGGNGEGLPQRPVADWHLALRIDRIIAPEPCSVGP